MIVLIDNYDSFTFNLFHYLGGLGADVAVHRNDKISVADVLAMAPDAIVLSPGPCTPTEAGICLDLINKAALEPFRSWVSALVTRRSGKPSAAKWCAPPPCTARCPRLSIPGRASFAASTVL